MSGEIRFREILPEPRRLWVRACPVLWPGAEGDWIDLSGPSLGAAGSGPLGELAAERPAKLDDVVYLPPVEAPEEGPRRRLAERLENAGCPVLLQGIAGTEGAAEPAVVDLTGWLLEGRPESLAGVWAGATTIWPWIAGLTDREDLWRPALAHLAAAQVRRVVAVAPELSPRQRRQLAERVEVQDYAAFFHRPAEPLVAFWRALAELGLEAFLDRPVPAEPRSLAVRRRVAGDLALAGDLLLLTTGDEVAAQNLLLAARRLDSESLDLEALVREGNLGLLDWLDDASTMAVLEALERGRSRVLSELLAGLLQDVASAEEER
jgi:hypothetical protein